jgi:hypothetical protein
MYAGELRGLKAPVFIRNVGEDTRRAFRASILDTNTDEYRDVWVIFPDETVSFYRGPNINDSRQRHYFCGKDTKPSVVVGADLLTYNGNIAVMEANDRVFLWGIPAPTSAPTVLPPAGASSSEQETRSYVYTFVNNWGEESAPSPASPAVTGGQIGDWLLSGLQVSYSVTGNFRALSKIRIYRTITGAQTVDFRFVAEKTLTLTTYTDSITSDEVSLNESLSTAHHSLPPTVDGAYDIYLNGLVLLPNGYFAAFVGSDIWFSEPYLPYAFSPAYTRSTGVTIIGMAAYSSGMIVCTNAKPLAISGAHPANMTVVRLDSPEPCLSQQSIVGMRDGVFYASPNGVVLANEAEASVVSSALISRTEWQQLYNPTNLKGAAGGQGYIGIYSASQGMILGPEVGNGAIVDIGGLGYVSAVQTDQRSGEVYFFIQGGLYQWNVATADSVPYIWESKEFETPYPVNFAAFKLKWNTRQFVGGSTVSKTDVVPYNTGVWNAEYIGTSTSIPLHVYGQFDYGAGQMTYPRGTDYYYKFDVTTLAVDEFYPQIPYTTYGGSELIADSFNALDGGVQVTVSIKRPDDDEFTVVYTRPIQDNKMHRLPSGFKADIWKVKIESKNPVYSFAMAETGRELNKT